MSKEEYTFLKQILVWTVAIIGSLLLLIGSGLGWYLNRQESMIKTMNEVVVKIGQDHAVHMEQYTEMSRHVDKNTKEIETLKPLVQKHDIYINEHKE